MKPFPEEMAPPEVDLSDTIICSGAMTATVDASCIGPHMIREVTRGGVGWGGAAPYET